MMEGSLSNLFSKIGMTGRRYTEQEKAKIRAMIRYGLSKNKAAQILHIAPATIWRWNIPATFKNKVYPPETRRRAVKLHKSGLSRLFCLRFCRFNVRMNSL
jgi:DNA invertase Pin-like site-specific DNA recombinase